MMLAPVSHWHWYLRSVAIRPVDGYNWKKSGQLGGRMCSVGVELIVGLVEHLVALVVDRNTFEVVR